MDNKRDRIVRAARERFRYYGIKKTTMREVAADAGTAVGTLYLYFKDKDDLIIACAEGYAARHREHAEEVLASAAPVQDKLRQYLLARFRQAEETRTSFRHAVELARAVLRLKPDRLHEEGRMMGETIVRLLKAGNESGEWYSAAPEADARVLVYSLAYFFPHALNQPPVPPTAADFLLVLNWFIGVWQRGAARPSGRGNSRPRGRSG